MGFLGVDFKRLVSDNTEEQRASLLEIIEDSNIDEVVKLCGKFKALLQINRSTVLQLYLKNEFIAAGQQPRSELKNLFKKHLKHIRYLTPSDVLDFIMGVCFDPLVASRQVSSSISHLFWLSPIRDCISLTVHSSLSVGSELPAGNPQIVPGLHEEHGQEIRGSFISYCSLCCEHRGERGSTHCQQCLGRTAD